MSPPAPPSPDGTLSAAFSAHSFAGWQLALAAAAAAAGCVWAYAWLRRTELPRRHRWPLVALRASFFVTLLVCLFGPVRERTTTTTDTRTPRVLVAVDHSASLTLVGAGPRRAAATRAIDELLAGLPGTESDAFTLGERLEALPSASANPAGTPGTPGRSSRLVDQLRSLADRVDPAEGASLLLVSDGRDTDRLPLADAAGALLRHGVQVFPVTLDGLDDAPPLARIAAVAAPEAVTPGELFPVEVDLQLRGFAGRPLRLELDEVAASGGATRVAGRRDVTAALDGGLRVSLEHTLDARGPARLRARLVDPAEGDAVLATGWAAITASVRPTLRVLYVQGALGWEHRHLRQAFAENPAIRLDSVTRLAPGRVLTERAGEPGVVTETRTSGEGLTDALTGDRADHDVVVLADVDPADLGPAEQQGLLRLVRERGGGVLFFSGNHRRATRLAGSLLEELLPVAIDPRYDPVRPVDADAERFLRGADPGDGQVSIPGEQRFAEYRLSRQAAAGGVLSNLAAIELTAEGLASPVWRDAGGAGVIDPPPATYDEHTRVAAVKPGATVLAVGEAERPGGTPPPVLVVQDVAAGSTGFLGVDGLWRWRMETDSRERGYDRFWQQLVNHLGRRSRRGLLRVDASEARPGDTVTVRADLAQGPVRLFAEGLSAAGEAGPAEPLAAVVSADGDALEALATVPDADHLRLRAEALDGRPLAEAVVPVRRTDAETEHAGVDAAALASLARETGGSVLAPADLPGLASLLERTEVTAESVTRAELWRNPWLFTLLLLFYAAELLLRHARTLV